IRELLDGRSAAGKRVAEVEVDGAVVGALAAGDVGGPVPRRAHQVFVLAHEVERAIPGVLPQGLVEAKTDFLDGAVLAIGGATVAVTHQAGAIGIHYHVLAHVNTAIVGVQQGVLVDNGFKAVHRPARVNRADAAIGAHRQVGSLTEEVAAAAIAPVVVGDQAEVLHDLEIGVNRSAAAHFGGILARGGLARGDIPGLKGTLDSRYFDVGSGARVERDLGDDIRVHVRGGLYVGLVVQLRTRQTGSSR